MSPDLPRLTWKRLEDPADIKDCAVSNVLSCQVSTGISALITWSVWCSDSAKITLKNFKREKNIFTCGWDFQCVLKSERMYCQALNTYWVCFMSTRIKLDSGAFLHHAQQALAPALLRSSWCWSHILPAGCTVSEKCYTQSLYLTLLLSQKNLWKSCESPNSSLEDGSDSLIDLC
jgi:hypothetical protein